MATELDYEGNVDMTAEATKDGEYVPEEDVSQEAEGQEGKAESHGPEAESADEQQFVYTTESGEEIKGTFAEIMAKVQELTITPEVAALKEELEALKAKGEEKPKEEKAEQTGDVQIEPVDWKQVGPVLTGMLEDNVDEIGPALQGIIIREVLTNGIVGDQIERFINRVIDSREGKTAERSAFDTQFPGFDNAVNTGQINSFRKENPAFKGFSDREAFLAMQARGAAQVKDAKEEDVKAAAKKASDATAKKIIETRKAAGTLRVLKSGSSKPGISSKAPLTGSDRVDAALAGLQKLRSQS